MSDRRQWGSGSIVHRKALDVYDVVIPLGSTASGRRRRKYVRFKNRADAEAALPQLMHVMGRDPVGPMRLLPAPVRHLTTEEAVLRALKRARALHWTDGYTARAIVAAVSPLRLRLGVSGPCVYCGDELANTVDHINPHAGDRADNLASACQRCNASKGKRTPAQWRSGSHDRFGRSKSA